MRIHLGNEASSTFRAFHFRPPDPVWAPKGHIEHVRKRLAEFDPCIGLWWSTTRHGEDEERPGRWRVVEWLQRRGEWTTACYWEGNEGQYLEPSVGGIIAKLSRMRAPMDELAAECDEHAQKREKTRRSELREACAEHASDFAHRRDGVRQTFAPGYIRRRSVKQADLVNTNHNRFLEDFRKKWSGAPT